MSFRNPSLNASIFLHFIAQPLYQIAGSNQIQDSKLTFVQSGKMKEIKGGNSLLTKKEFGSYPILIETNLQPPRFAIVQPWKQWRFTHEAAITQNRKAKERKNDRNKEEKNGFLTIPLCALV